MEVWSLEPDPFAALGLPRDATPKEIKSRYYFLARRYHPNRNEGPEESKRALGEYFHRINQAWQLLSRPEQRRRWLEMIELVELEDQIEAKHVELDFLERNESSSDDWSSSDADDYDLTHLTSIRRARSPIGDHHSETAEVNRGTPGNEHSDGNTPASKRKSRGRMPDRRESAPVLQQVRSHHRREGSDAQSAATRRKKLAKYKKKELEAFHDYKEAMVAKLHAELESERRKEIYEAHKWKRARFEAIPKGAATRVQMAKRIADAVKVFKTLSPKLSRRPTLNIRGQIMAAGDHMQGGEFLTVSSPSTTRGLGINWRGYTSDISGDQTSSDDNAPPPGPARRHFRSPSAIARRRIPEPYTGQGAERAAPSPPPPQQNGDFAAHAPIQILVKRATGFGGSLDGNGQESSGESLSPISGHSRSTSPQPPNGCRDLVRFSIEDSPLQTVSGPHHRRAMSAPGQSLLRFDSDPDLRQSKFQGPMLLVKTVGDLQFPSRIPRDHVHKLGLFEEERLLKPPPDFGSHPQQLLDRLEALDPAVANRLTVKPDIKKIFAFRLICSSPELARQQHHSFIALSYRRKKFVEKSASHYSLPLDKEMLQAVWEERISEAEGLWVDQICIDQDSDDEKTISMSAMDMVYRSARLVVVVLDDLDLKEHEGTVLENHIREYESMKHVAPGKRFRRHQPPYLETHGHDLLQVLQKILTSSWFRRAWCRHEMRLARDHLFLLPCHTAGSYKQTVLRLTSACIAHLLALATEVPFDASIELIKPALHAFFRDRTQPSSSATDFTTHHGNFSTVIAEVFGMETGGDPRLPELQREADARRDKVSIILNTMECGLALKPELRTSRVGLSKEDCYYSLMLLALAARDPGALCSVGKPMQLMSSEGVPARKISSWLFEPTNVDAGLNNYRTLNRISADSQISCGVSRGSHYIQLDLKFLRPDKISQPRESPENFNIAREFVLTCETRKLGRHRKRYLIHDAKANDSFGDMRDVYIETVACTFACGPDWMTQVCQRYGVSRYKQDLQPACWLMVALRNMNGKWPKADWVDRAASFIMDIANFMIIRGMPQRQLRQPEKWRPVCITTLNKGKLLTFRPAGPDVRPVVPTGLLDADYVHLARLWMVSPRTTDSKWTLLGKSVMFSDDLGMLQVNFEGDMVRRQQKVFGRSFDSIEG